MGEDGSYRYWDWEPQPSIQVFYVEAYFVRADKNNHPFVLAGSLQHYRGISMEVPQIVLPKEGTPMLSLEHDQVRRNKVHGGRSTSLASHLSKV